MRGTVRLITTRAWQNNTGSFIGAHTHKYTHTHTHIMIGTREQYAQILGLLVAALAVFLFRQVREHDGASNAITAISANCDFAKPGAYRDGPYGTSIKLCERTGDVSDLFNHLRVYCKGMDACVAAEFGSLVAVGYLPFLDLVVINPTIVPAADTVASEMLTCVFEREGGEVHVVRHHPVVISFIDENRAPATRAFHNRGACYLHAMEAAMRGE